MSNVEAESDTWSECPDRDMENIFFPELDQELFLRLKRDDPSLTKVSVSFEEDFFADTDVDWEGECDCIGKNSHLKELDLYEFRRDELQEAWRTHTVRNFEAFCRGLSMNKSIQCLFIDGISNDAWATTYLPRFILGNSNIRRLHFSNCFDSPIQIKELVSVLSSVGEKIRLQQFIFSSEELNPQAAEELIGALSHHKILSKLVLEYTQGGIGRNGCLALRRLLNEPSNKLRTLELNQNGFDNECLGILGQGLAVNGTLKKLILDNSRFMSATLATTLGWQNFLRHFTESTSNLEEVDISWNNIGDEMVAFVNALRVKFPLMKRLKIGDSGYTVRLYEALSGYLQSPSCALETLDLSGCRDGFGDEALYNLSNALRRNLRLRKLNISECVGETAEGWRSFFVSVQSSSLVDVDCGDCHITDGGIQDVRWEMMQLKTLDISFNNLTGMGLRSLSRMCNTLETLVLTRNALIDVLSLVELADVLRDPRCSLKELRLTTKDVLNFENPNGTSGDNRIFAAFADALAGNKSLEILSFENDRDDFMSRDWNVLSTTLCNSASITETYASNHTFNDAFNRCEMELLRDARGAAGGAARNVWRCMEWNKNSDKSEVARQKIIYSHFVTAINGNCLDTEYFINIEAEIMPHLLAWAGRDSFGHSSLYELLRTFPSWTSSLTF